MNEEQTTSSDQAHASFSLKEQFTTVTPLSKGLAGILFVALPFIGFFLGVKYGSNTEVQTAPVEVMQATDAVTDSTPNIDMVESIPVQFASTADTSSWSTYSDAKGVYSFRYPSDWSVVPTEFPDWFRIERNIGESKLVLNTNFTTRDSESSESISVGGRIAVSRYFDGCLGESLYVAGENKANSPDTNITDEQTVYVTECVLTNAYVPLTQEEVQNVWSSENQGFLYLSYGAVKDVNIKNSNGEQHLSTITELQQLIEDQRGLFDGILSTIEFAK